MREIGTLVILLLAIGFIGATLYFGMAAEARKSTSTVEIIADVPQEDPLPNATAEFITEPLIELLPFNPAYSGERNIGQEYQFTVKNVTSIDQGLDGADITYHWTVNDYRVLGSRYTYYSPNWGQWFRKDADPGNQFLAVWVRSELSGNSTWYGWGPDRFKVWVWDNTTRDPEATQLEDLPFESDRYQPVVIAELQDLKDKERSQLTTEWYGWKDQVEVTRQEPGRSAAWEGMILFQIPEGAGPEVIRVLGYSWYGYSVWYLTPHENLIQEVSPDQEYIQSVPEVEPVAPEIRGRHDTRERRSSNEVPVRGS
jgi:hypothetical protein